MDYSSIAFIQAMYAKRFFKILHECLDTFTESYSEEDLTDDNSLELMFYCLATGKMGSVFQDSFANLIWNQWDHKWNSRYAVKSFVRSRILFYQKEKEKLMQYKSYTPMRIFNTIILNPLVDEVNNYPDFTISPFELLKFQGVLKKVDGLIKEGESNLLSNFIDQVADLSDNDDSVVEQSNNKSDKDDDLPF
ncbi:MAG: hypothetical protein IKI05_00645 [Bacteroidaceae bacterium]|nr:hypothetical protein [Bacteroidaceae bacterium]